MQERSHRASCCRTQVSAVASAAAAEWDGKRRETSRDVTCEFYEAEEEILFSS